MRITIDVNITKATTKRLLILGAALFVGLTVAVVHAALTVPTFASQQVLDATPLNQLSTDITNLDTRLAAVETAQTTVTSRVSALEALPKLTVRATTGAIIGSTPPAGTQFFMDTGDRVLQLDASGNATITFSTPFPNGVLSVVPFWSDVACGTGLTLNGPGTWVTKSTVQVHASCMNQQVRITYIAVGW